MALGHRFELAQPIGEHVPERHVRQWESRNKRT